MKFGDQFEGESVPQWSLYNIDYNALKHHIKAHTTKDQAAAIAIPGHQDTALRRFEDGLFSELCRQHDRVDLFVSSKADEIARRLQHLSNQIQRLLLRCAGSSRDRLSTKKHRRFAKYEQDLLQCGNDSQLLRRFVDAQIIAFRKILKKYRKWTGSSSLGSRFRDTILSHPKSFSRRDFSQLQSTCDDLLGALRAASPVDMSGVASPVAPSSTSSTLPNDEVSPSETLVPSESQHMGYWNEYDHGSDAGDARQDRDESYAIYIDPNENMSFPGVATLTRFFSTPVKRMNKWMAIQRGSDPGGENGPLLPIHGDSYGTTTNPGYFAHPPGSILSDTEAEDEASSGGRPGRRGSGYSSLSEFPGGYKAHYAALPSVDEQSLARYRERVLTWSTLSCFAASLILMGIAAILVMTGRHKMRLEVDAGVTVGIMASLGAACAALGMTCSRQDALQWTTKLAVWTVFTTVCVLNGALLVFVVGNTPL